MRNAIIIGILAPWFLLAADGGAMSDAERSYLLQQLEESKKGMLASIDGLSEAQWKFKPAPNVWSVQECAEHIVLAEEFILSGAQGVLKTAAVPRPASSTPAVDQQLVAGVKRRDQKFTAPEPIVPSARFPTPADAAKEFTARREKTVAYVKSTQDELRTHVGKGPVGPMDGYQFLLLLSAHSARHTAQIEEVKANAAYPK